MLPLPIRMNPIASLVFFAFSFVFSLMPTVKAQSRAQEQLVNSPQKLIQQMKASSGGSRWDAVKLITADGEKKSFGLVGKYQSTEELSTGFFERRGNYGLLANAEGLDRSGRWRQDNSGQIHPLDSEEAEAVATSDAYLARRGYFFPERVPAKFRALETVVDHGKRFDCVEVTPQSGRAFALWIDSATHLLDRTVMELSEGDKTVHYSAYREAGGLALPFKMTTEYRDDPDVGTATITTYQISTASPTGELQRPQAQSSDASIVGGAQETSAKAYLDSATGFYIVEAEINGKGPYPFILDTGGHNILTPFMCRHLGLRPIGDGFSTGAGSGTTKTQFTSVQTVSLGGAVLTKQPFTVLYLDLGMVMNDGMQQPIAGILGLELLERFAITMNYKARMVTLQPSSHFACHGNALQVPFRFTSDMPIGSATLDGHEGLFGIDTGNNVDLIVFRRWAVSNRLADEYAKGSVMDSTSVGGNIAFTRAHAKSFQIAGHDLGATEVLLGPETEGHPSARSEAGSFGNSVLSHFTVTFDYLSEIMCLQP